MDLLYEFCVICEVVEQRVAFNDDVDGVQVTSAIDQLGILALSVDALPKHQVHPAQRVK
tara:strand:+ start:169 stop:345 length:177 start_codon:yes stop_codon:yes gene_type:complete